MLIEALILGVPVISSNCKTGPREILANGKIGKLFKVGNVEELKVLILEILERSERKNLKENSVVYSTHPKWGACTVYKSVCYNQLIQLQAI